MKMVVQRMNRAIEFPTRTRAIFTILLLAVCLASAGGACAESESSGDIELDHWFNEETKPGVPQASEGELVFLSPPPESRMLHSINTITLSWTSLDDGWVQLRQCYKGLDAVPVAEVVYQYKKLRHLRIHSKANIGQAVVREQTVQLNDVQHDATLCIQADAQILYPQANGRFLLRNGPFHRRFLDSYFPLHVSVDVQFPSTMLHYVDTLPQAQPGFKVDVKDEHLYIDTWFAGMLNIEVHFLER